MLINQIVKYLKPETATDKNWLNLMRKDVIKMGKKSFLSIIFLSLILTLLSLSFVTQADAQTITVSGTVYTDEGITPMADGRTVRIKSNGAGDYSDLLDSGDGTYIINNVPAESGTSLTVFLDGAAEKGTTVARSGSSNITDLDIYQNHVVIISYDSNIAVALYHMAFYDKDQDTDILFDAENSAPYSLTVDPGNEFYIRPNSSFFPILLESSTIRVDDIKILGNYAAIWALPSTYVSGNWINQGTYTGGWNLPVYFNATSGTKYIESGASSFDIITFDDGGGGATWVLEDSLNVLNKLTITSGTLDTKSGENNSINLEGNWTNSGTFTANLGTVTFDDDFPSSRTITTGGDAFYNLTFSPSNASTPTLLTTYTLEDGLDVDNDLSIVNGTFDTKVSENNSITVGGDWLKSNPSTFVVNESTVTFDGTGAQSITSGGASFYDFVINSSGTYTLEDDLIVKNDLTISAGTLDVNAAENNSILVEGNWKNSGTFLARDGYVVFNDDQSGTHTITSGGSSFNGFVIWSNENAAYTLKDALDADGLLWLMQGTLDTDSSGNNSISVGGDWSKDSAATFTANSSTVTFDGTGAQSITTNNANWHEIEVTNSSAAGVTFVDKFTSAKLTCTIPDAHLTFKSGETFEITDTGGLDLQGADSQPIVLSATNPGSQWTIDPSGGSWTVSDVDLMDSINANILYINPSDSIDSGNNYNWFSQDECITRISPSAPSIDSGGSIEFSATNAACIQTPAYTWSVTSVIGSTFNENGLYTAGTNNNAHPVEEDVDVTDTANSVTDTVTVCVGKDVCSVALSPKTQTVASRKTIQFSAANTGCTQGSLTWEVNSSIGSRISASGLYTAGTNSGADTFVDTITLTDTSNCVLNTATVTIPGYSPPQPTTSTTTVSETVTSTTTSTIAAVTTTIAANTTTTTVPCELRLTPQSGTAAQGETITFEITSSGECNTSQYEWSLSSNTDSSIEARGTTCLYTAGENYTAEPLTDTITVRDTANGDISAVAIVTLNSGEEVVSLRALPDSLAKDLFLPYPAWLSLEGTGTRFDPLDSVITLDPPTAVWPLFTMVTDSTNITSFILVMPSWFAGSDNEPVTITVTTGDQSVSATVNIEFVPSMMGEEINIK